MHVIDRIESPFPCPHCKRPMIVVVEASPPLYACYNTEHEAHETPLSLTELQCVFGELAKLLRWVLDYQIEISQSIETPEVNP